MNRKVNCFFSEILNRNVYDGTELYLGKLKELIVTADAHLPEIKGITIKTKEGMRNISFKSMDIIENGRTKVIIHGLKDYGDEKGCYQLSMDILDKQIVDINGRRVVRVNDLTLSEINGVFKVLAADIGMKGILRRIGLAGFAEKITAAFGRNFQDNLILWDNVEPVSGEINSLSLAVPFQKLKSLHPADIADILEDLDVNRRNVIFDTFDTQLAADTLEELEDEFQSDLVERIDDNRAKEIFENMPADEIADILDDIDEDRAEGILSRMDEEDAKEIKELLEYDDDEVGSIMVKEFISFCEDSTVDSIITCLRETQPDSESAYYLYITDKEGRLSGILSLRSLIISKPETIIKDIMNKNIISIKDTDKLDDLTEMVVKYELLAIPVIDENNILLGMAVLNDIVYELLMPKWKRMLKKAV